jgi:hypothetical protein
MPANGPPQWNWRVIVDTAESAVFPPWHVIVSDEKVKGAVFLVVIATIIALTARFFGPSNPFEGSAWQLARVISAVIPPLIAVLIGIFSVRSAWRRWQQWLIFGAVAWLFTVTLLCILLGLLIVEIDVLGVIQSVVPVGDNVSAVVLSTICCIIAVGWLYHKLSPPLRKGDPRTRVFVAFVASVGLFTLGTWIAIFMSI